MSKRPLSHNYAGDQEFGKKIAIQWMADLAKLKDDRKNREEVWKDSYREWSVEEDATEARNYQGRANLKLPQLRKEVETMSRRLLKALFPEDYLKGEPTPETMSNSDLAIANTQVMRHYLDRVIQIQARLMPWMKQNVLFGTSPLRSYWKRQENEVLFKKRFFEPDEFGALEAKFKTVKEKVLIYNAPYVEPTSLFNTFVYPHNATHPDQIQRVYWETKLTLDQIKKKQKEGVYVNLDGIEDEGKDKDVPDINGGSSHQEIMAGFGDTGSMFGDLDAGTGLYDVTEIYGVYALEDELVPVVVEVINGYRCVRVQRNPYWHQSCPFTFGRFIIPPVGQFYGRGLPEASLKTQAQLDDTLNQSMDSTTMSLNQITIINPAFAPNADSFEVEPGAIWWADPNGVKSFQFPDLSDSGLKNANVLRGIITEMSDNSPQLPDPIAGKARSTGQAQLAINEWQTDLYSFVNQIAIEALSPMVSQIHSLLQQNIDDDTIIRISGKYASAWVNRVITPADIVGRYDFSWIGAIQIENQSVKTQQMLNFLKILPMIPPQAGVNVQWDNLLIKLLRDGFGIKDVQNIINTPKVNASIAPSVENRILDQGGDIDVELTDDDTIHMQGHMIGFKNSKDPYVRSKYEIHMRRHDEQAKKKQIMAQQAAQAQMMMMAQQGGPGMKPPGGGAPPQNRNNPNGNPMQMQQATNPDDMERGMRG